MQVLRQFSSCVRLECFLIRRLDSVEDLLHLGVRVHVAVTPLLRVSERTVDRHFQPAGCSRCCFASYFHTLEVLFNALFNRIELRPVPSSTAVDNVHFHRHFDNTEKSTKG